MATTPEGKIKAAFKRMAAKYVNVYVHMPVLNGMGAPTLDFIVCCAGYFIGVEAKAPGKKPTARPEATMMSMGGAGAVVRVIDSLDSIRSLEAEFIFLGAIKSDSA